jgi:hypothetical protein
MVNANATKTATSLTVQLLNFLPASVQESLSRNLRAVGPRLLSDATVRELKMAIRANSVPAYDRDWAPFAYLYYGANAAKAYLAGRHINWSAFPATIEIVDLGCGGGSSIVGLLAALKVERAHGAPDVSRVVVVDKCNSQLELFRDVAEPWIKTAFPHAQIVRLQQDALDFVNGRLAKEDLVLASYLMSELDAEQAVQFRLGLRVHARSNPLAAFIIESDLRGRGLSVEHLDGTQNVLPYDNIEMELGCLQELGLKEPPKFSQWSISSRLLMDYFDAWRTHSCEIIERIFAEDAVYEILGNTTLSGRTAIIEYWNRNSAKQRFVRCWIVRSARSADTIAAEWRAEFDQTTVNEHRSLHGFLWLHVIDGQIERLTELYDQRITEVSGLELFASP